LVQHGAVKPLNDSTRNRFARLSELRPEPSSELVLYQTEDGQTRIHCRFEGETLWPLQNCTPESI